MKETEDIVLFINENQDLFQKFPNVIAEGLLKIFAKIHDGNDMAIWGNFNEAELRNVKRNVAALNLLAYGYFAEKWLRETADHYGLSESMKDTIINTFGWVHGFPVGVLLVLEDETLTPIPIVACMAAGLVTIKISKRLRICNNIYNFLRSNMMRTIPTNRLHTLTTSVLWQNSSWNLTKFSIPIFFLSSSYLYPPNHQINPSKKRTAESTTFYQFIAFCITAATFANAFSLVLARVVLKKARKAGDFQLVAKLLTKTPGIGAGAIAYSLMATCASLFPTFEYPQSRLSSISLAFILHEIRYVALIFSGRKYIDGVDHFARLGGILFGFFYARYGNGFWENVKQTLYRQNKQLLETVKPKEMESILHPIDLGTEIIALKKDQDYFVTF